MKLRRFLPLLIAIMGGALPVKAQFSWNGQLIYPFGNSTALGSNWVGGVAPSLGTENASFGDLTSGAAFLAGNTQQNIDDSGVFALRDITFNGTNRPDYNFNGTGTFALEGNVTTTMGRSGGANISVGSGLALVLSDVFSATHTFDVNDMSLFLLGNISQVGTPGRLVKNGNGTLYLAGNNTFTGGLTINAGTVFLSSSTTPAGTGTLTLNNGATLYPFNHNVILPNTTFLPSGTVTFNSITDSVTHLSADSLTFNGVLSGAGMIALYGAGPVTFANNNFGWLGGLTIFEYGTVNVNNNNGLGTGTLTFDSGSHGHVIFNTSAPTILGLVGNATNSILDLQAGGALNINQFADTTYQGTIVDGSAAGSLVKSGSGTLTLTGSSSYRGTTTVTGGTLAISGATASIGSNTIILNHGTLAVINGASLPNNVQTAVAGRIEGTGHIASAVISAGTLAPGASLSSIGTLNFDTLSLNLSGTYEWNLKNPSTYDQTTVNNAFGLVINTTPINPFHLNLISLDASDVVGTATGFTIGQSYQWNIFSTNGITGFSADKFVINSALFFNDAGPGGFFSLNQVGNNLQLSFTAVPEPSTWVLILLGTGVVALGYRRRAVPK